MVDCKSLVKCSSYVPKTGKNAGTLVDVIAAQLPGTGWRGWACMVESVPALLPYLEGSPLGEAMEFAYNAWNAAANLRHEREALIRENEADGALLKRFSKPEHEAAKTAILTAISDRTERIEELNELVK